MSLNLAPFFVTNLWSGGIRVSVTVCFPGERKSLSKCANRERHEDNIHVKTKASNMRYWKHIKAHNAMYPSKCFDTTDVPLCGKVSMWFRDTWSFHAPWQR